MNSLTLEQVHGLSMALGQAADDLLQFTLNRGAGLEDQAQNYWGRALATLSEVRAAVAPEWLPAEDAPTEEDLMLAVFTENTTGSGWSREIGYVNAQDGRWYSKTDGRIEQDGNYPRRVRFWQPLPELPS